MRIKNSIKWKYRTLLLQFLKKLKLNENFLCIFCYKNFSPFFLKAFNSIQYVNKIQGDGSFLHFIILILYIHLSRTRISNNLFQFIFRETEIYYKLILYEELEQLNERLLCLKIFIETCQVSILTSKRKVLKKYFQSWIWLK